MRKRICGTRPGGVCHERMGDAVLAVCGLVPPVDGWRYPGHTE